MQLKRLKVTLEDKTDFSGKSKEEKAKALTELEQECINRIVSGIVANGLIKYEVVETDGHGFRVTGTIGVYDIDSLAQVPDEHDAKRAAKKKVIKS